MWAKHPDDAAADGHPPARRRPEPRVSFDFDGALDDVPTRAAGALAGMARALLSHADEHEGRPATMRVERLDSLLNLWLTDPECSPECLGRGSDLPGSAADGHSAREVRLLLDSSPDGGLRLHWMLHLSLEPVQSAAARPTRSPKRHRRGLRA